MGEAVREAHDRTAAAQAAVMVGSNRQYVSDAKKIAAKDPEREEELATIRQSGILRAWSSWKQVSSRGTFQTI